MQMLHSPERMWLNLTRTVPDRRYIIDLLCFEIVGIDCNVSKLDCRLRGVETLASLVW